MGIPMICLKTCLPTLKYQLSTPTQGISYKKQNDTATILLLLSKSKMSAGLKDNEKATVEVTQQKIAEALCSQQTKRMRPASNNTDADADVEGKSMRDLIIETLRTVKANEQRMKTYEQSIEFVHIELEAQRAETASVKRENEQLKQHLASLEARMSTGKTELRWESDLRDEGEQNSRMVNLEVSGLTKLEGETREDCKQLAADVMKLVNSEFGIESVDDVHRKMAGGLIVRFLNRTVFQKRFAL